MSKHLVILGLNNDTNTALELFLQEHVTTDTTLTQHMPVNSDLHTLVLIDCQSFTVESIMNCLQLIEQRQQTLDIAFINTTINHSVEKMVAWPSIKGFFYQTDSKRLLQRGILSIFDGEHWVPRKLLQQHLDLTRQKMTTTSTATQHLTNREIQILQLTATGATNTEIANNIHISTHTVKTHLYNLYRKINVSNRIQAVNWAKDHIKGINQEPADATY